MKKLYFTLFSILSGLTVVVAQTLTATNHAPAIGDVVKTRQCDSLNINAGSSGTGQFWNFSTISVRTPTTVNTGVTVASTGSTSSYPSASVAMEVSASNRSFYSNTSNELLYWGGNLPGLSISGISVYLINTTPAIYAKYPMSFNTTTMSVVTGSIISSLTSGTYNGTCTINADGTGTLALPGRTFTNVMRVINTQTLNFTTSLANGKVTQTTYDYYSNVSKAPLFTINSSVLTSTVFGNPQLSSQSLVTINSDYLQVGIKEQSKEISQLNVFPNPAKNNFNISLNNENADLMSYEMINVLGQSVRKEILGNAKGEVKYNIETGGIESGIYFVKVNAGNATSIKKITIQ